ncbi:hypothetical protein RKE38_01105 [Phycicoccus sp. M110.8]|uniref:hypothetical protein n=1 Tax=Phycicoccus sp. M110.8 TaxID=3075433 RepID=UPI0028FD8832|nr:hypothetical protein [Phycicoccus sp. M110.8]MDU0312266.1 hypothetical protein [Phycicoccus sp. M110.8]
MVSALGGVAAALTAALLGVGAAGAVGRPGGRPWLVVLHDVNAGRRGVTLETLRGVHPVDVALLVLAAGAYAGFWPRLGAAHHVWLVLAVAQPVAGVPLLLVTRRVGRSGLMGGALVVSVLLLVEDVWVAAGWLGAAASALLLVGDFDTTGRPNRVLAATITTGYAALFVWFWVLALLLV